MTTDTTRAAKNRREWYVGAIAAAVAAIVFVFAGVELAFWVAMFAWMFCVNHAHHWDGYIDGWNARQRVLREKIALKTNDGKSE